jgi:FeS assembly SUF system regulator
MFRMTRLTDYGMVLLTCVARDPRGPARSARDLADEARLPRPTASKILKRLAHHGLLVTRRGVKGGFALARPPEEIAVAEVVSAMEGPVAITVCSTHGERCGLERVCGVRNNWRRINRAVYEAMSGITLADMIRPLPSAAPAERRGPRRAALKDAP